MTDFPVKALDRAVKMGYAPLEDGPAHYPPVQADHVYEQDGTQVPGYTRLYREDSGDTLAIHTDAYELRPYHESFDKLEIAIRESALDQRNLMARTEFSHNGGRCFRSYLFPHIGMQSRVDDTIALQILAFDSYDGSYSTAIAAGGFRYICLNGCFFGKTITQLKVRHVTGAGLRFDRAVEKVVEAAQVFTDMQPRLTHWTGLEVDVHCFKGLLKGMPQMTDRLADHLVSAYATTAEEQTLYGAWNILTSWATGAGGTAQTRVDRDRRVAALIESREWRRLEG